MSEPVTRLNAALEGRYRIERELGEGGMATVYLADDLKHERKVALKVLKPELAAVIGAERFLAEIKTTANLQHPHILPLHDSGEADGLLFYVMPYVEGESLRERLDRDRQLGVDEAVGIATKVGAALQAAHERGVIHRDIKPANILLSKGEPLISDFGIALAVSAGGGGRLTETGLSLGTPHYMSPEQATGDLSVGAATDLYALGCVLYEMLVGEPPYTGSTPQAILGKIIQAKPVSATEVRQTVPAHVDAVIRRSLEKVPADRFRTASEFVARLGDKGFRHGHIAEAIAGGAPVAAASQGPWKRMAVGFAASTAILALVAGWAMSRPEPVQPIERFDVALPADWSGPDGTGPGIAVSPDGSSWVVASNSGSGSRRLWIRRLEQLEPTQISGSEDGRNPVFSRDGSAVAFSSQGRLVRASLGGAPPLTLVSNAVSDFGVSWSDDEWLYFMSGGQLHRVSEHGGATEAVTPGDGSTYRWPSALPGGRGVLLSLDLGSPSDDEIVLWDAASGEVRTLFQGAAAHYAASGHLLYTSGEGTLLAAPFDLDRLEATGPAATVLQGVQVNSGSASYFSVSQNGTLFYREGAAQGGGARLALLDLDGNLDVLPLGPRWFTLTGPSWSPDGESVAFESEGQIYTYNTVLNTTPRQITFEGTNFYPVYSPDGTGVAFSRRHVGSDGMDLFVKDLTEDTPPRLLLALEGNQRPMGWPFDTLLVFTSGGSGSTDLWTLDLSNLDEPEARPYLTAEADLRNVAISPDGRYAAYSSDESGGTEVYVRSFPDPGVQIVVSQGGGDSPFWSLDGNTLYYRSGVDWIAARLQRDRVLSVVSLEPLFSLLLGVPPVPTSFNPVSDRWIVAAFRGDAQNGDAPLQRLILIQNFFEELRQRVGN
jgi:Tol biopolymer transport system component